jgi:uncharacterized protein (UPF0248 family)
VIPIQKLLSRIRWDASFGDAFFEIDYEDRIAGIIRIPLNEITSIFTLSFSIKDNHDRTITIPLHRVKGVYRNGDLIWSRTRHDKLNPEI